MGTWTINGLILAATPIQTPGANAAITYVGISPGCGTLATAVASGTPITSVTVNSPGIPANLAGGATLSITDGTNTETFTVVGGGATAGATTININSWTPAHSYAINTTVVAPSPNGSPASDVALYGESVRAAVSGASAGSNPGESLNAGYFDGTQPTAVYYLIGFFGGAAATSAVGTGTLMGEDLVYWNHTINSDTNMFQADSTI